MKLGDLFTRDSVGTRPCRRCGAPVVDCDGLTTHFEVVEIRKAVSEHRVTLLRGTLPVDIRAGVDGFAQTTVQELADYAGVPVWNGLTNEFHPTQILADLLTMQEHSDKPLNQISFAYLGDAKWNFHSACLLNVEVVDKDTLCCFWTQIDRACAIG